MLIDWFDFYSKKKRKVRISNNKKKRNFEKEKKKKKIAENSRKVNRMKWKGKDYFILTKMINKFLSLC